MIWTTRAYSGPTIPYFVEFLLHCEYLEEITLLRHKITAQQREKKDKRARHSLLTPRHNSELKQGRSRRWERRRVKNDVIFYQWISQLRRSVQYVSGSKNVLRLNSIWQQFQMEIRKLSRRRSRSSDYTELGRFTFSSCTKIYNARAQLLFYLLYLLFGDVLVPSLAPPPRASSNFCSCSNLRAIRSAWKFFVRERLLRATEARAR